MARLEDPSTPLAISLQAARTAGMSLHEMPAAITGRLAEGHRIYTLDQPEHPGKFRESLQEKRRVENLRTIGRGAIEAFKRTPGFEEAAASGTLSENLTETFAAVTHLHAERVHVEHNQSEPPRWMRVLHLARLYRPKQYETVVADSMELTVPTEDEASLLMNALHTLLHKPNPRDMHHMDRTMRWDGAHTVMVGRVSEHDPRSISRTHGAILLEEAAIREKAAAQNDGETALIARPKTKLSLAELERRGQTFPPATRETLVAEDVAYQELKAEMTATTPDSTNPNLVRALGAIERPDYHLIVTDPAPMEQGMRDLINRVIWRRQRRNRNANPEQNPDRGARPTLEAGTELRRDPEPPEKVRLGPPMSRAPKWSEMAKDTVTEAIKKDPLSPIVVVGSIPLAFTWSALIPLVPALRYLPSFVKGGMRLFADHREWRQQKRAAAAVDKRLDELAYTLVFQEAAEHTH